MFIVEIYKEMKKKKFLLKSAKTALLFAGKSDKLIAKLEDDKRKLLEFSSLKANKVRAIQASRLRSGRSAAAPTNDIVTPEVGTPMPDKPKVKETGNKQLYKTLVELNLFGIVSQAKIVKYFNGKAKLNNYTKYILAGGDTDAKLESIFSKCDEVYKLAKSVATDDALLALVERGYIGADQDLAKYKDILAKYI